jgi:hypothetical protein
MDDDPGYAHNLRLRDGRGRVFLDHGGIWLLELSKFAVDWVQTEEQRWLKFFNEAEQLNEAALPEWMQTQEMRQAMSTLIEFSEKERAYHAYQARQNYLRRERSIQRDMDELRAAVAPGRATLEQERTAKEQAHAAEARERAAKETALIEIERLRRLLQDTRDVSSPDMPSGE